MQLEKGSGNEWDWRCVGPCSVYCILDPTPPPPPTLTPTPPTSPPPTYCTPTATAAVDRQPAQGRLAMHDAAALADPPHQLNLFEGTVERGK